FLTAPPASAEPPASVDPEARRLAEEGLRHFDLGQYADAIRDFKAAYLRAPSPELLYDLAQAYRLSGDCPQAAAMYRRYLATSPTGRQRARTDQRIAEL